MSTQHVLNLSPVRFEDAEIPVGIFQYQGKEQLQSLRDKYNSTHVFRRDMGNRILCVPVVQGAHQVGETTQTIRLYDNLPLCAALIRNALLNHLHGSGWQTLNYEPIKFMAGGSAEDILVASLPSGVSSPPWLAVKPLYEAVTRVVSLDRQSPFVGITLDLRTTRLITITCDLLLAEGFPITGLYVGQLVSGSDARLVPHFELIGRVQSVQGKLLILDDARPGVNDADSAKVVLEPRYDALDLCLSHAFREQAPRIKQTLTERLIALRSGPTRLEKLRKLVNHFGALRLEMVPGMAFTVQPFLAEKSATPFPILHEAPKTIYVFDPTCARTDTWHDRGINEYGPYTAQSFTPTHPRICVICQATRKGQVEQFLHKLFHGITLPGDDRKPFAKGFIRKYALEDVSTEFFPADGETAAAYQQAVRHALAQQAQRNIKWDLALVQIDERFHQLYGEANPYLLTKAAFLAQQIPVQEFEIETAALPDKQLGYVLNNMALATYAKLGGVPWLIKANPTIAHELVVGLGSARVGVGRMGKREQMVGITTVFTGDGNYWLSNLSQAVPIADYKKALLASLQMIINKIQREMNWQPREHVRLVFHAFKPFKDVEADAVKALVTELVDYDVEYAFLHVVQDHPYLLFDEAQRGFWDYQARTNKGVLGPMRGRFFRLSDREVLISLTGAKEVKRPQDGMPHPILLRLHRGSSFQDTTYLARQVFAFSCHSWRSFFPAPMPVTILYSELIAKMLGQLESIPRWNPDAMLGRIGTTRWFL